MRLVLASTSPSRRKMLEDAGVPFTAQHPELDEEEVKQALTDLPADVLASTLAERKARSVAMRDPGALVLGSDSVVELDGERVGKPGAQLSAVLRKLSGRTHRLHSAACLIEAGEEPWSVVETATLAVRPLSDAFIADYVARDQEARWCAGGYRIEGLGAQLFERVDGSWFAILGLPLLPLLAELRRRGILTP